MEQIEVIVHQNGRSQTFGVLDIVRAFFPQRLDIHPGSIYMEQIDKQGWQYTYGPVTVKVYP